MSNCGSHNHPACNCKSSTASQTLDELNFERGIWYAAQYGDLQRLKKLIEIKHCPVDARDSAGYTALHYAARNGHLDICKYLITNGADINATTRSGLATALHRSSTAGQTEIVRYLVQAKANIFLKDIDGKSALQRSIESNHRDITELLLNYKAELT